MKRIFISQGDSSLSGIEYSLINVLKNLSNYKWFIIANKKREQSLCKYLNENNFSYKRFYVPIRKIKLINYIFLYFKFIKLVLKDRKCLFYVSGIMMIIIISFLPIKRKRKNLILRNDIRALSKFQKRLFYISLYRYNNVFTNSIFNYRFINRYIKHSKTVFTFDAEVISKSLIKKREKNLRNNKEKFITIAVLSSMRYVKNPNGIADFINIICEKRHDVFFKIIGSNQELFIKKNLSLKSLEKVKFLGVKSKKECLNIFLSVNYLLSLSFSEGCPNAVVEAMRFGIPCILSNIVPHNFLTKNDSNYIIPINSLKTNAISFSKELSFDESIGLRSKRVKEIIESLCKKNIKFANAIKKIN